tara:strand:+ start:177 stop:455 length:279 start_codon:yes stop_codon:yes gene_type:complete
MLIDFIIFGITDNAVMIFGAFTGYEVEKYLPKRFQLGHLMPIVGAGLGNTVSDFMGGVMATNMPLAFGSAIGCLIGLILIPIMARFMTPKQQ